VLFSEPFQGFFFLVARLIQVFLGARKSLGLRLFPVFPARTLGAGRSGVECTIFQRDCRPLPYESFSRFALFFIPFPKFSFLVPVPVLPVRVRFTDPHLAATTPVSALTGGRPF